MLCWLLLVKRVLVRLGILVGCASSLVCYHLHKFFPQCLVCRFAGRLDGFVCDQIHQNTNGIDNRDNPSSALPTGHFIDPLSAFRSGRHSNFVCSVTRVMYSVSVGSFGAEYGRPLMCLMFQKSHSVAKRFPSICLANKVGRIDCTTNLFDPELLGFSPSAGARSVWLPCV